MQTNRHDGACGLTARQQIQRATTAATLFSLVAVLWVGAGTTLADAPTPAVAQSGISASTNRPPPTASQPTTAAVTGGDDSASLSKSVTAAVNPPTGKAPAAVLLADSRPMPERGYLFTHETVARVPWSVYVVKAARHHPGLDVDTAVGHGTTLGMAIVSQQVQMIPRESGRPVVAINGDMFQSGYNYRGDPDGLQIVHGELVSSPHPTRVCFWIDAQGNPHRTNVITRFQVTWPNGTKTLFGLNEERESDMAVLYTSVIGPSTRTYGGREFVLGPPTNGPWVPLQIGKSYPAVIKSVNEAGNTPLGRQSMVLSLGPSLAASLPKLTNGATLHLSTATIPDLGGAQTGIGGGPTLVADGKPWHWPGFWQMRHPRSAIGWNKDYYFFVVVDGRQIESMGMTFAELANYMIKLGCDEALNLDGGGSATLWVDGRVVNNPSQGYERPAANSVVLIERSKK
jgi:hypothetical protein